MEPVYFRSPEDFRAWLASHHASERELLLGFYKKRSGVTGFTQAQAVEEALCYGWIDGHVRAIDTDRYTARFTPRTPHSIWSAVNLLKMEQLIAEGRVQPAGLATFEGRDKRQAGKYSYENAPNRSMPPTKHSSVPIRRHGSIFRHRRLRTGGRPSGGWSAPKPTRRIRNGLPRSSKTRPGGDGSSIYRMVGAVPAHHQRSEPPHV